MKNGKHMMKNGKMMKDSKMQKMVKKMMGNGSKTRKKKGKKKEY